MQYTTTLELEVCVEVVEAVRGHPSGRWTPPEPDEASVRVTLGTLEITDALAPEVLADVELDALDRLRAESGAP